ncbi:MAG: hypothetical protein ACTSQJ_18365 [Promethearchaeota archaeon]
MPIRIRWNSKEYIGIALILLGACGLYQVFIIFIAQFFLSVGNYIVLILIPIGVTFSLYYGTLITFESFAQVERRERLRSQYRKQKIKNETIRKIIDSPLFKPLAIMLLLFSLSFFISYLISNIFLDNVFSFIISEFISALICLFCANYLEKNYAKVRRI